MRVFSKVLLSAQALRFAQADLVELAEEDAHAALNYYAAQEHLAVTKIARQLTRYQVQGRNGTYWLDAFNNDDEWTDYDGEDVIMYEYVWVATLLPIMTYEIPRRVR